MFKFLRRLFSSSDTTHKKRAEAIGIDVSSPEFYDLYPAREDIYRRLNDAGIFRHQHLEEITSKTHKSICSGRGAAETVKALVRTGDPLTAEEKKALGINVRRKVGGYFISVIQVNDINQSIGTLTNTLLLSAATARHFHNLRRMEEAEISTVKLLHADDERVTALEYEVANKEITISEARQLVINHEEEIQRSCFIAKVEFGTS